MIQRKQSIYLFLAALVSGVATWFGDLWKVASSWVQPDDDTIALVLFSLSFLLSLCTIFLYKNRKLQILIDRINIFLNILLLGYLSYSLVNLPGGFRDSEKGIGLFAPFISIALLLIANRFIKKDEKLVKSVDRFR